MSPPPHSLSLEAWAPPPGQGEGEQAWIPITTTRAFIIQLTLRGKPGTWKGQRGCEGNVMEVGRGRGGLYLNPPKLKKPGQAP